MNTKQAVCAWGGLLLLVLVAGCGQVTTNPATGKKAAGVTEQTLPAALTGNPVTDAGNALMAGDFRFKAIQDEHGAGVVPGGSKLKAQEYGYDYQYTMIFSADKGITPSQRISLVDKVYFYAASYNTTVLNYMKDHPRGK